MVLINSIHSLTLVFQPDFSQTVDDLSEQVTTHRRDLPQRWADAVAAREEVMEANREKEEMERERLRKKGWGEEKREWAIRRGR